MGSMTHNEVYTKQNNWYVDYVKVSVHLSVSSRLRGLRALTQRDTVVS